MTGILGVLSAFSQKSSTNPLYFYREYKHDFPEVEKTSESTSQALRMGKIALPFIALYQPIGRTLACGLSATRVVNTLGECFAAKDYKENGWKSIEVPGIWEKSILPAYNGIAWYRVHFNISDKDLIKWEGKKIGIVMGAIDDADVTYLNGVKIGEMGKFPPNKKTAWDKPRVYKIDKELLQDNNVLAVRVCDWTGSGGIWQPPIAIGPVKELNATLQLKK